jgi:hypothetical protein
MYVNMSQFLGFALFCSLLILSVIILFIIVMKVDKKE